MIRTKSDYLFYLNKDREALSIIKKGFINQFLRDIFFPYFIYVFQRKLRRTEYYKNPE